MRDSAVPRPDFDEPTAITLQAADRFVWGDSTAQLVRDWIFLSNDALQCLVFGMSEGDSFRHSAEYPTYYGADEVYIVLQGRFALANPETGEVLELEAGEAAYFGKETWHHGFNIGAGETRVLEYFSPPPSQGTGETYASREAHLPPEAWRYEPETGEPGWPGATPEHSSFTYLPPDELLWTLQGDAQPYLLGLAADTSNLRVGAVDLRPGHRTDREQHQGDEALYVTSGTVRVEFPDNSASPWLEAGPDEVVYIPGGVEHAYRNTTSDVASAYLGIGPNR